MDTKEIETVIIGAGQAGLAAGYHLQRRGRPFVILDANTRVGDNWHAALEAMEDFHSAVEHALSDTDARRSNRSMAASRLAARKRPELFPVRDRIVCEYLGILALQDVRSDWLVFRALLQDDRIRRALPELPDAVARASGVRTVMLESSDLRLLHAALWTHAREGSPERSVEAHEV